MLYIGITGITQPKEVKNIATLFKSYQKKISIEIYHKLLIGLLISQNLKLKNLRMVSPSAALKILTTIEKFKSNGIEASIHIRIPFQSELNFKRHLLFLSKVYNRNLCKIIQINNFQPRLIPQLRKIKNALPEVAIILPVAHNFKNFNTIRNLEKIGLVDAILIDSSKGRGIEFDVKKSVVLFNKLRVLTKKVSIGFAGGLNPKNVNRKIVQLKKGLGSNKFSLDVESGVRNEEDKLEIKRVKKYIYNALTALYL
jgi:phosphoribosylanthranilate isomerase